MEESRRRFFVTLLVICSFFGGCDANNSVPASKNEPFVSGIVLDSAGKPLAGVEYWVVMRFQNGRPVWNTGYHDFPATGEDGKFQYEYSPDDSVNLAFRHPGYAPTYLLHVSQKDSPQRVKMDPGARLNGQVVASDKSASTIPADVYIYVTGNGVGESVQLRAATKSDGTFSFLLPSEYWKYNYDVQWGTQKHQFSLGRNEQIATLYLPNE